MVRQSIRERSHKFTPKLLVHKLSGSFMVVDSLCRSYCHQKHWEERDDSDTQNCSTNTVTPNKKGFTLKVVCGGRQRLSSRESSKNIKLLYNILKAFRSKICTTNNNILLCVIPGALLTRMPSHRDTARSGLRALSVRMERKAGMSAAPAIMAPKLINESFANDLNGYSRGNICVIFLGWLSLLCRREKILQRVLTMTITKSSQHHAFVKYTWKPKAKNLINISMKNITVNIRSI